jgi:6,7-dimethyl-8-ribityllumazine synthase
VSTNLTSGSSPQLDGTGRRIALVCARFNDLIVDLLEAGARRALRSVGVSETDIETIRVPGALEAPSAIKAIVTAGRFDAVVALGAVMRGDTYHFEVVSDQSAAGIMQVALDTGAVITNGILTVDTVEQADERSGDDDQNKGAGAALAAIEMLMVLNDIDS